MKMASRARLALGGTLLACVCLLVLAGSAHAAIGNPVLPSKSADNQVVSPGDEITYTIGFTNILDRTASFDIYDTLPDGAAFVSASDGGQPCDNGLAQGFNCTYYVLWSLGDVPPGDTRSVTVVVSVEPDAGGSTITNLCQLWCGELGYNEVTEQVMVEKPVPPIPEPPTYALFGVGLVSIVGFLGFRRLRHRTAV
jgi:uncharacterized repeat protein (TIGR01451 family)